MLNIFQLGQFGRSVLAAAAAPQFPTVLSITPTAFASDTTQHLVAMPAVVANGDLLICLFANDGSATVTTPGTFNLIAGGLSGGSVARGNAYYRIADGTEGGTTVDFVTSANEQAAAQVYRIQVGTFQGTPQGAATAGVGTTNSPNPPSVSPAWGSDDGLVIAGYAGDLGATVSVYPYANGNTQTLSFAGNAGRCECVSCWETFSAASVDPGTFTKSNNNQSVPFTIAVRAA